MSVPARTTVAAVQDILGPNYDLKKKPSLARFVASASDVVDQVLLLSRKKSRVVNMGGLKPVTLASIETWLAAHFYCVQDPLYTTRSTQGASGGFQRSGAKDGFSETSYGKQALSIDWSGCLTNIDLKQFAGAIGMGYHPDQDPGDGGDTLEDGGER